MTTLKNIKWVQLFGGGQEILILKTLIKHTFFKKILIIHVKKHSESLNTKIKTFKRHHNVNK